MFRTVEIPQTIQQSRVQADRVWRVVVGQPGWISRIAALAFLLVVGLPILLLIALAVFVAVIVFGTLALANALLAKVRGVLPRNDGRENVRVIRRAGPEP